MTGKSMALSSRYGFAGFWFGLAMVVVLLSHRVRPEPVQDKQALLAFILKTPHENRLQWNASGSACSWVGVQCDANLSSVYSLRLPAVGLIGPIPANTIGRLTQLRILSLRSNRLSGEIPSDFSNLKLLRSLYLQNNQFSGEFPTSIPKLTSLIRLDISSNNFTGTIPVAVDNLTHLTGLFLENNGFTGELPSLGQSNLKSFNASNNRLNGSIPASLSKFPASAFAGNPNLCGGPLPACSPQNTQGKKSGNLSTAAIIAISVGSAVALLLVLLIFILCLRSARQRQPAKASKPPAVGSSATAVTDAGTSSSKDELMGGSAEGERNKLVFFEGGIYSFDLEDLLRASAEVLGKGSIGTSYKAVLEDGTTVVVKRLKDVAVTKKEFEMHMEVLGKIKHDNVVPLRAYYFSRDEKLLVFDFMAAGSLSALLHGSRGSGRTPLDWDNRMRIALSTARGLAHLHVSGKVVHGNIKASNVLLRRGHDAGVADFGLYPLFPSIPPPNRTAGYRAPEVVETRKVTFKSDVYSFGVLLLELLTGKSPSQPSLGDEGIDLPRWVQSVVREEWTAEVFDAELMRYDGVEEEMVQLLQIAMACVSTVPDQRPSMPEVLRMMEEMNRGEGGDGLRQPSDEPWNGSQGQTRTPPQAATP